MALNVGPWVIYSGRRINANLVELSVTDRTGRRFKITAVRGRTDIESLRELLIEATRRKRRPSRFG